MLNLLTAPLLAIALLFTSPAFIQAQAKVAAAPSSATSKIDINSATATQLNAIPGIGPAYSKRIIDGRPYANKTQLVSHGVIPAATYDQIKNQIIATQPRK